MNVTARLGAHKGYQSRDQSVRAGARYFLRNVELAVDQTMMVESKDDGRTLHPMITTASVGMVAASALGGRVGSSSRQLGSAGQSISA